MSFRIQSLVFFVPWWFIPAMPLLADDAASEPATFQNPILAGFHADPSICRVGDDYYLANSSFEYFPGVPLFHSCDLVHWQPIGYALSRKSQLPLEKMRASGGIYAPTLRYHDGTFYMVTTNVDGGGNFYVTAADPAGPWSEPIWLDKSGIDPSLFFDDDGTVYYTRHVGMGDGYIGQQVLDLKSGKLVGEMKEIWRGTGGQWPEGPHLYKKDGRYYLMIAEGGTSYDHRVTVARSDSPWGPFEAFPHNPILTHANRRDHPIQALGHADLVETPAGWWLVCLGIRPQGGSFHTIGRETYLAPVTWSDDGWPAVGGNGTLEFSMTSPALPTRPWPEPPTRDNFSSDELALEWNFVRNPHDADWSLSERPGYLRLHGSAVALTDRDSPALICQRQMALACRASTRLSSDAADENEEAGLVIRGNDANHLEAGVTQHNGRRQVFFRRVLGGKTVEPVRYEDAPAGDVVLTIAAQPLEYEFMYQSPDGSPTSLGTVKTHDLSSEKIGGFTGAFIGLFATGNGKPSTVPADFDWFDYTIQER
ncbi:MAG TPA: glycoside hydrolase family 43 protein [Lacipirellulaceae bacterium]